MVGLILIGVAVVVTVWLAGLVGLRLLLGIHEVRQLRQGLEPVDVAGRIAVLEHDVLDWPLGHDGCRWCLLERAYATDHGNDSRPSVSVSTSAPRPVRQA